MTASANERFSGVFTALVTPFSSGGVDFEAFDALVERQIAAGVSGLVPVGTTGEAATLSDEEADQVIRRTVKVAAGRAIVIAGAGSNSTAVAIEKAQRAKAAGADGLLVVTPYYNKPTQAGLVGHYQAVCGATDLPVMLYSVPGRCGVEIAASTCARLRETCPNVVAIKEAGGSVARVTEIRRACGADFPIHSGDDGLTLPFLASGAVGVTSVVSNVAPAEMVAMVSAWQRGDWTNALSLHDELSELFDALFIEANPGPAKAALAIAGLASPELRAPMAQMEPDNLARLSGVLSRFRANPVFQEIR
ncbi:4-hydroxy-tetrahydrodipicolinate synthase [Mesorhizobium sp. CAU 1741]|uniref:4-hydroxy-tetrahydrodipicolinate synthase n=1 Tax=Mesorhizobium sp. CAU 1741 TaxID=3140366 RepID=UPI00325B52D9